MLERFLGWFWRRKVNELRAKNCEFTNWRMGELCALNYEFTNWEIVGLCATKHILTSKTLDLWELTHEFLALNLPLLSPQHIAFRIPPGTSPPPGGSRGGRNSRLSEPPISHRILSHPLLRRGLGRPLFLLNYFPSVFQSTPFCVVKDALLHCKRACFDV